MLRRLFRYDAADFLGSVYALAWLVFLAFPLYKAVTRDAPAPLSGEALGAVAFAGIYGWFWMRARGRAGRGALVGFWALLFLSTIMTVATAGRWITLFIYVSVLSGAAFKTRSAIWAVVLVTGLVGLLAVIPPVDLTGVLAITFLVGMLGVMTIIVRRLIKSNYDLEAARDQIAHLAVADERARIARDVHDLLGHSLSVIVLKAELASRLAAANPSRAIAETQDIERVAREALKEVREAVAGYRQATLAAELERARSALVAAGIAAAVAAPSRTLPPEVETVLAWAVREGVTNVVRHSGARTCQVNLDFRNGTADLEVLDDGGRMGSSQPGSGLRGLDERVAARRGTLIAGRRSEGGFRLLVSVPLEAEPT